MVREHGDPAADRDPVHRRRNGPLQPRELAVDLDAQRLEGPLGRVAAGPLGGLRQGVADQLDEPGAVGEGLLLAPTDDRGHDPLGLLLLAVLAQDPDQLARRVGVQDLGGADARGLVHPHVQRRVLRVSEPAVGLVQLHGGDAQVEEDALDGREAQPVQDLGEVGVDRVDEGGPVAEGREPLAGEPQGLLVAVEADQTDLGEPGQQGLAVAAEAEGAVDDDGPGPLQRRGQQVQAPLEHHRDMSGLASQSALSDNGAAGVRTPGSPPCPADAGEVAPAGRRAGEGRAVRTRRARGVFIGGRAAGQGRAPAGSRHFSATVAAVNEPPARAVHRSRIQPAKATDHSDGGLTPTPVG